MVRRGAYSKGIAKREEILEAALEIVARVGYSRTTVRELAESVGLSQTGLLHYFGSKEQLFAAILARRDETDRATFTAPAVPSDLPAALIRLIRHNTDVPGLVELYARFSAEATRPEHPAHDYFRDRYRTARDALTGAVADLRESGRLPADLDADRFAVITMALLDGLQTQWLYDPAVDMAAHVAYLWELIERSGNGAERSRPPR
ncbi:TetR/AcrR family transcriptional regulator [Nocardia abscessus]|uniref:TetR/AcrR family transcriptional regulator n=1 Tax=Nocardia abscessus TaxID=120957 RepID=UPI0002EB6AC3|nr:TetR/AcrR family transcriptional regulator [Nocardia abscessus]MCC3330861.1 TetR/AcrR family transcriptional regulator [Nocardia abscessus]